MYRPNIPLSAHHTSRTLGLNNHTKYIPPHPQRGTPYHRYVMLLLQQPPLGSSGYSLNIEARAKSDESTSLLLDIPVVPDNQRKGFDLRSFMRKWGLDMREGGGVHMWREVWDGHVSTIYEDILSMFFLLLCHIIVIHQSFRDPGTTLRPPSKTGSIRCRQENQEICQLKGVDFVYPAPTYLFLLYPSVYWQAQNPNIIRFIIFIWFFMMLRASAERKLPP